MNRQSEKPVEMNSSEGGKARKIWIALLYVAIILVVAITIYYLTRYNSQTFIIGNQG